MRIVFCGTPVFAVATLDSLVAAGHTLQLVVTQPDRPRGRGLETVGTPVKEAALRHHLPVLQPETIKNDEKFRTRLQILEPEAIVVVGYGRIIPRWMLELPKHGNINLHASLLPRYRGAAPIQWAIANGDEFTGVTTMLLNVGLDTGDILLQRQEPIYSIDTAATLAPRLAAAGAELMAETLRGLQQGTIQPQPQPRAGVTLAPILTREDGRVDFQRSTREIYNRLRGFQPWPGAFTSFRGKSLNLNAVRPLNDFAAGEPGTLTVEPGRLLVSCGDQHALELEEVQPEGKRRMSATDFINGYQPRSGEKLGG